jgi:hypothetical protein
MDPNPLDPTRPPVHPPGNDSLADARRQPGSTRTTQEGRALPRLPHERDESADSQQAAGAPGQELGRQAYDDLQRGVVDTDRGPVMNWVYQQLRRWGGPPKPPR